MNMTRRSSNEDLANIDVTQTLNVSKKMKKKKKIVRKKPVVTQNNLSIPNNNSFDNSSIKIKKRPPTKLSFEKTTPNKKKIKNYIPLEKRFE